MFFRSLSVLSAGVVALAMAGAANADNDLVRLDGKGDAETVEARYGGGGGFRGGYGGFGGYRGGFGYGGGYRGVGFGYGGYRGYGYGGYRGGYAGYYRPYYRNYGYGLGLGLGIGLGYGSYYSGYGGYYGAGYGGGYYSTPAYYSQPSYSSYSTNPCTCATSTTVGTQTLYLTQPAALQNPGDGTFPYDGGPSGGSFAPSLNPAGIPNRSALSRDGRLVSIPSPTSGYQFAAFGETPIEPAQRPAGHGPETLPVSFPAFGEPMPGFTGGTGVYTASLSF